MKYQEKRIGHYTLLIKLLKDEIKNVKERYICYNDISFKKLQDIINGDQIVVINESATGGYIIGNGKYSKVAFDKLKKQNSAYEFKILKEITERKFTKISFSMQQKKNSFKL